MKVIFLDIDGVLRTADAISNGTFDFFGPPENNYGFDKAAVRNLNLLLDETDARIVISSSLRLNNSIQQLSTILKVGGVVEPPIIGVTPVVMNNKSLHGRRGKEILKWLSENPSVENYLVIDDCDYPDLDGIPRDHIVKTTYQYGFGTDEAYQKALEVLQYSAVHSGSS